MKCGSCLIEFNSYLKLQFHKAKIHGERNQFSSFSSIREFQGSANRKERETTADEKLHEAISRWRHSNT